MTVKVPITNVLAATDAMPRVAQAKIPSSDVPFGGKQYLANGVAISNTAGVVSQNLGNPATINLMFHADVAATFAVWTSPDGNQWFHDTSMDVVFAAPGDKVYQITGATFVKVVPSAGQTAGWVVVTPNYY